MHSSDLVAKLIRALRLLISLLVVTAGLVFIALFILLFDKPGSSSNEAVSEKVNENKSAVTARDAFWKGPSEKEFSKLSSAEQKLVRYGKDLIVHTADYLGPKGSVGHLSNGMNCQNCHLDAGSRPWGNNYFAVEATYPKFRARSGQIETQAKRINDCFERSLNGKSLDTRSPEMKAMLAYMKWVGTGVPTKVKPKGSGIFKINDLDRAADPVLGKAVYK